MVHQQRVARLVQRAAARGLEAVVIMPGPNLFYLTGLDFHLSERPTLLFYPVKGEPFAFCPGFEAERLTKRANTALSFSWGEEEGPGPVLVRALRETGIGLGKLGVEYRHMRVLERELLAAAVGELNAPSRGEAAAEPGENLRYEDAGLILAELRMKKDQTELTLLQEAAAMADAGIEAAHHSIKPGISEHDVAAYMGQELQKLGAQPPFHINVASGPRSAIPHADTSERILQEGELVWVDWVYQHQGYVGDITRTFAVGKLSGMADEIYAVCLEAQARARAQARPGMTGAQIDAIARAYIIDSGYGSSFIHRTGHGLGLEVHEEPYIVGSNHQPVDLGFTFTIEPGIYVPGLGGVRIEDDVVMEEEGLRSLTQYPRDLRA